MELTGRENIYLNGAILGMRKQEIDRKFAEIVEFAELQRFIDTPIKRYSSGMQVRLAFAVAAHLESEILLVDEVLAVGDARFQRKCMAKMEDVGRQGRTVLFVSHSMPAITRLCGRALLFDEGRFLADGPSPEVVGKYLSSGWGVTSRREWSDDGQAPGGKVVRLRRVQVVTEDGEIRDAVDVRRAVGIQIVYDLLEPGHLLMPWFELHNEHGVEVMDAVDVDPAWRRRPRPAGVWTTTAWIPENLLAEGTFFVTVGVKTMEPPVDQFVERDVVAFQVVDPMDGETARGDWGGPFDGAVRPLLRWRTSYQPSDD
jgi:lipopolysaccharide transport system ATP-binding protein